ncbi:MAG: response regulator [Bacteroidota bacterium]|nr:response regulator [Bacteroidota bacterium]MDP4232466.1 response regulator [Bacteroidota bacterium]MDP4241602.1 response regulator [Bacteroidota bacterium]MDP4286346.1 response regulator [Bacteroidota bacterium]
MHLHQELEGYYLGMPDTQSGTGMVSIPPPKSTGRSLRAMAAVAPAASPSCVMLILEDFDEIRAFLSRHFTERGYEVFSSCTLRDALAIAWEESPHVIIIDYDLSGETALHAIERLHSAQPNSHIVLVGGPQTVEVEERAILAGASTVLSKAYGIAEMDRVVERAAHLTTPHRPFIRTS